MLCHRAMQDNVSSFGAKETDIEVSDEEPDICHMPAVHNPLPALKHAELSFSTAAERAIFTMSTNICFCAGFHCKCMWFTCVNV